MKTVVNLNTPQKMFFIENVFWSDQNIYKAKISQSKVSPAKIIQRGKLMTL